MVDEEEVPEAEQGEWIRPILKGYENTCCDCGLVHIYHFRIKDGSIEFRVWRKDDNIVPKSIKQKPSKRKKKKIS